MYISEYIPAKVYGACRVRQRGIPSDRPVALFRGSVVFVRLRIESLSHEGEQIKDLFHRFLFAY